jgi:hypothetical protein
LNLVNFLDKAVRLDYLDWFTIGAGCGISGWISRFLSAVGITGEFFYVTEEKGEQVPHANAAGPQGPEAGELFGLSEV